MKSFPLIDLHQDLMLHIQRRDLYPDHWQTNFEMLARNDVRVVVATAFPVPPEENYFDPVSNDFIEEDFRSYAAQATINPRWSIIRTAADVTRVIEEKLHGILMHVEGLNVVADTAEDWARLERWYQMGWRSLGVVWNLANPLGGGTKDETQGLTEFGAKMINWLQERRMIVDFAHMNVPTFADAARLVKGPIIVSHGCCSALCKNPRNYTDDQLQQVAATGGVVGVFFAKTFVTGRELPGTVVDVVNHVDHLRKIMGIDHIALGTDFGGIITGHVQGLESLDTMPVFWGELARRGYTEEEMEMIAYKNAARVLIQTL